MNFPLDMFPNCIHFMTLTYFFNYFIIIVYTFLETLLYTVFITTLSNGNDTKKIGSKKCRFICINIVVLT